MYYKLFEKKQLY